jgi:alkanesulfonate monooxygenase SsuD/methylene tetrahydromethanopterin reductase-like flavin-dependent oxidoreductase (luciferase family)
MKIGLMHLTPYSKADPAIVARRAEELGFESYWVGDHTIIPVTSSVQYPGARGGVVPDFLWQLPDPLLALARAGATTTRIKLGTGVCLIPERNPILTAKQVATLDDGTGGRVLFRHRRGVESGGIRDFGRRLRAPVESGERLYRRDEGALGGRDFELSGSLRKFPSRAMFPETRE